MLQKCYHVIITLADVCCKTPIFHVYSPKFRFRSYLPCVVKVIR